MILFQEIVAKFRQFRRFRVYFFKIFFNYGERTDISGKDTLRRITTLLSKKISAHIVGKSNSTAQKLVGKIWSNIWYTPPGVVSSTRPWILEACFIAKKRPKIYIPVNHRLGVIQE